jgi:transcriptional regulator of arginine metabolism
MRVTTARRRQLIAHRLQGSLVESQEVLASILKDEGIDTTQATISRDLAAIGALKGPDGYVLSGVDVHAPLESIRDHALSVTAAASIVVIKTAPGHAHIVGVELDRHPPPGVLGTIAGDDTLFLATADPTSAHAVTVHLSSIMHL